jgi:hypothetical protein
MSEANFRFAVQSSGDGTEPGTHCVVELIAVSFHYIFVPFFRNLAFLKQL